MKITTASHVDHALTVDHLAFIEARFADRDAFFIATFELPPELDEVPCALYGPSVGDPPVTDAVWANRPGREYPSKLIDKPTRPTRTMTVIGGPHEDEPCIMYTAFGGPVAPKEFLDPTLVAGSTEQAMSAKFWSEHALAKPEDA